MRIGFVAVVFSVLLAATCSTSDEDGSETTDPENLVPKTFQEIQTEIFSPSCTQSSCHDSSGGGGLILTDATTSYVELVNVPAVQAQAALRGKILVVPGNPANSFLIQKLDGTIEPDEGEIMPRSTSGLSRTRIEQIKTWIEEGAPNN